MKRPKAALQIADYITALDRYVAVLEAQNRMLLRERERMLVKYGAMVRKVRKLKR
jgi:hypothetical protein